MSIVLNMVGGGAGGLNPNDALIHVNAPLGSTVDFTLSSVIVATIPPAKAFTNSDGETADYYYIAKADGTYTVTATLTPETASNTVVVNGAGQYDIALSFNLYLFRNGAVHSAYTMSYQGSGRYKINNDGILYIYASTNSGGAVWFDPVVDCSQYRYIEIKVNESHCQYLQAFGLRTSKGYPTAYENQDIFNYSVRTTAGNVTTPVTLTLWLNTLAQDNYYFGISVWGASGIPQYDYSNIYVESIIFYR